MKEEVYKFHSICVRVKVNPLAISSNKNNVRINTSPSCFSYTVIDLNPLEISPLIRPCNEDGGADQPCGDQDRPLPAISTMQACRMSMKHHARMSHVNETPCTHVACQ